jgi:hypothetical protein
MRVAPYVGGFILLLLTFASNGKGQGICVIPTMTVSSVKGKVLSKQGGVPQSSVELRDWKDQSRALVKVLTDVDGNFEIKDIKNGRYLLIISRRLFSSLHIPIKIESKRKGKGKLLLAHIAPDYMEPCSEGGVELTPSGD